MSGTDLVYSASSLAQRKEYASALANAGELVPDGFRNKDGSPNPAKLLLAFEYGAMLGLHPVAALQGINVIKGKASPAPALMTALVRRAGHKLRVRQTGAWPETYKVTVTIVRTDDPANPYEATWDEAKARRAKLWPASGDSSWAKYPEAMCMWRAVSEVCRMGAEDVMFGAHYVPEELGVEVNEAGEVIEDAEIVEQDHDGPNVAATMREPAPVKAQPKAAAPTRAHAEVLTEWASRIGEINNLDALIKLHAEAADRHVLDHRDSKGTSIEDVFLARRETILAAQAQDSAEEGAPSEYDEDALPF